MRPVIYARISKDEKGKKAGVDRQLRDCSAFASTSGLEVLGQFFDNNISASEFSTEPRPAWEKVVAMLRSGEADAVLCFEFSRCYRRPTELEELLAFVKKLGRSVYILFASGGIIDLSTASGRKQARDLGSGAAHEVELKGERQRAANFDRVRRGKSSTKPRQRPFGYNRKGRKIVPEEAEAIRKAYAAVIAQASLASIARSWNAAGFETSRGKPWTSGSVSLVLASPRYMGQVVYKREAAGPAEWKAIVDERTWRNARARLRVGTTGQPLRGRTLLGMQALCGVCQDGTPVQGGSNNGRRSYRCSGKVQHLSRAAEPLESYVSAVIRARLARGDVAHLLAPKAPDMTAVIVEADGVRARMDELAIDFADGSLTASQVRIATARLRERLDALESELARGRGGVEFAELLETDRAEIVWEALDTDARRRVIGLLVIVTLLPAPRGRHDFDPTTVEIAWKTDGTVEDGVLRP